MFEARLFGEDDVPRQVAILSVNRHEVLRLGEPQDESQILLARMPGNVNVRRAFPEHLRAAAAEVVDERRDRPLVARDHARS